jgi:PhnB protein
LFFEGRCEEAVAFYRAALGAEVTALMRFGESPDPPPPGMVPPGSEYKVMHAELRIGDATVMASDGRCSGQPRFGGVSLSLSVPDEAAADRFFAALAEDAGRLVRTDYAADAWPGPPAGAVGPGNLGAPGRASGPARASRASERSERWQRATSGSR